MWDRKTVKSRGKIAFQANYWRCVLVAFIMAALICGGGAASKNNSSDANNQSDHNITSIDDVREYLMEETGVNAAMANGIMGFVGAVIGVSMLIGVALKLLVINPLEVGCSYFFFKNGDGPAEIGALERGFKPAWINNAVTLLLRDLFIALWSLLFVIPGVIKAYAYRMTPYIQAEHPEMSGTDAIKESTQMMKGQKMKCFIYDLSFIGWYLLEALTLGILGVFYVHPYKESSDAELYRAISDSYYAQNSGAEF